MPLHSLDSETLRAHCKRVIENLERWLRRLIDDQLSQVQPDYLNMMISGQPVFRKALREDLPAKSAGNPARYRRPIDAATLEDEIAIITNEIMFERHFREPLKGAFPDGREECRTFLSRLIAPRNHLYHANPISVRQAEQVVCYANDVIDALKGFYISESLQKEFNVPMIVEYRDSFGTVNTASEFLRDGEDGAASLGYHVPDELDPGRTRLKGAPRVKVRSGESITMEVVIDPSFDPSSYTVGWSGNYKQWGQGTKLTRVMQPSDVGQKCNIICTVTSIKEWHRMGHTDDVLYVYLTVLPPLT